MYREPHRIGVAWQAFERRPRRDDFAAAQIEREIRDRQRLARALRDQHVRHVDTNGLRVHRLQLRDRLQLILAVFEPPGRDRFFGLGRHAERVLIRRQTHRAGRSAHLGRLALHVDEGSMVRRARQVAEFPRRARDAFHRWQNARQQDGRASSETSGHQPLTAIHGSGHGHLGKDRTGW